MLTTWTVWILASFSLFGSTLCLVHHGYMTHYYYAHKPVFVNDSMILELTNKFLSETPGEKFLTCDVNIVTSESRRLMIHFLSLEISYADKDIDRLHIYDFKKTGEATRISPPQGLYGISDPYFTGKTQGVEDYESTSNRLKLDYQGKPTLAYNGFKILITSIRDARGDCGRGFMRCSRKEFCIPVSTWCDGNPNCGAEDHSDEATCNAGPLHTWNPIDKEADENATVAKETKNGQPPKINEISKSVSNSLTPDQCPNCTQDGQITAVVASAVSCTLFLITTAILVFVVMRLNKRDVIVQNNITVKYKQKGKTKRQVSKSGEYAPPSYEVVIGMNGAPPPYQLVATPGGTESDVTFDEELDGFLGNGEPEYETLDEIPQSNSDPQNRCPVTNNIQVTCDIHGNNVRTSSEAPPAPNGCLELTQLRLCSQAPDTNALTGSNSRRANTNSLEIEVLESGSESDNEHDVCVGNGSVKTNGVKPNGVLKGPQLNGHTKVSFNTDMSTNEGDTVAFIDNEP